MTAPAPFATAHLAANADAIAPDGSEVRILCATGRGSMAHFRLPAGAVAHAVAHRTVEEIWFVIAGTGRLWRRLDEREEILILEPGGSATIPTSAHFQFRNDGAVPLDIVAVTMPPWPGETEAYRVASIWRATIRGDPRSR
jgi:mannose-6-phosphate isomerase-like protein (cupin superfamily)